MSKSFVYLDHNATTPVEKEVMEACLPYFTDHFGNASSNTYSMGLYAANAVKIARKQVADCIGADESEIIFTSGATEACNIALRGIAEAYASVGKHIITVSTEHKAVLDTCEHLEAVGYEITYLKVNGAGMIDTAELEKAIRSDTILIAVMYANNETGVLQPVARIGEIAKKHGVIFFSDATQAIGKVPVNVTADKIDLMALSGHKIYAPKGVGALYIRRKQPRVRVAPFLYGGGQEKQIRSGTLNVPGIVAIGKACSLITAQLSQYEQSFLQLKKEFLAAFAQIPEVRINGDAETTLPNTINFSVMYTEGKPLLAAMKDHIGISSGSACMAHLDIPSYVLRAMGISEKRAAASFRISMGRMTTRQDVAFAIDRIQQAIEQVRAESVSWKNYTAGKLSAEEWK